MEKYETVTLGKSAFYFFTAIITITIKVVPLNINENMLLVEVSHCGKVGTLKLLTGAYGARGATSLRFNEFLSIIFAKSQVAAPSPFGGSALLLKIHKFKQRPKTTSCFWFVNRLKTLKETLLVILHPCLNSMSLWSFHFISSRDFSGTSKSNPSIYMSLYRAVRFPFLMGAVFRLLICGIEFVNPLLLQ